MKKILITGINSYIGNHISSRMSAFPNQFEPLKLSLKDSSWESHFPDDCDCVVHVAGIAHVSADPAMKATYDSVNRDLTLQLASHSKKAGVPHFIFLSSSIVYGNCCSPGKGEPIDLETPLNPSDCYGRSKAEAEAGLMKLSDDSFAVAIVRSPMVYGPSCKGNFPALEKMASFLPIFPDISNKKSMIYIDNLAELITGIANEKKSGIFLPQNAEYTCTSLLVQQLGKAAGHNIVLSKSLGSLVTKALGSTPIFKKAFGDLFYSQNASQCEITYQIVPLNRSLEITMREDCPN